MCQWAPWLCMCGSVPIMTLCTPKTLCQCPHLSSPFQGPQTSHHSGTKESVLCKAGPCRSWLQLHDCHQFSFVSRHPSLVLRTFWNISPIHCIQQQQFSSLTGSFQPLSLDLRQEGHIPSKPLLGMAGENTFPKDILSLIYHLNVCMPFRWLLNHIYWESILNIHSVTSLPIQIPSTTCPSTCLYLCLLRTFHRIKLWNYRFFNTGTWKKPQTWRQRKLFAQGPQSKDRVY